MSIYETYLMIKQAAYDYPDLQVNPKNKITRLLKDLKWGLKRNGHIISDYDTLFDLTNKDILETIGDDVDALNIASCVDKVNRVSNNTEGIGALATFRSDWELPHITPLFKYKGKYYTRNSGGKYSSPYDNLDEIGDRWYRKPVKNMPIPDYVDFYDLPAGTILETKDIRKILDEVKQKAKNSYRKYYKQASLSDEQQLAEARKFIDEVKKLALKKNLNFFLVTDGASGISNRGNPAVRNAREAQIKWELENGYNPYDDWGRNKPITFPKEEIANLKGKKHFYTTRVSSDYDKYNLGDTVTTPWGDTYVVDSEDIYDDVKKHKFYNELTKQQLQTLGKYNKLKLLGLTKKATRLYTYVEPDADLSKGILSALLAPEDILMRRYKGHDYATNKENILKFFDEMYPTRAKNVYALDAPIPDNANEQLRRFRDKRKLVSFDAKDIKDLIKITRRRTNGPPTETTPDFEPRKHVQWGRDPSKVMKHPGRGPFHYAPVYALLTESGKIPAELLTMEDTDKYSIHGAILGCLGKHAKDFDYNITEKLPNDPWKAIINTKPMTMEQVRQFHKYHNVDVDKAGVPYYFLTRNERTGDKAVWYSDDATPLPINNKKEVEYAQQVGKAKGLIPDQLNFKF